LRIQVGYVEWELPKLIGETVQLGEVNDESTAVRAEPKSESRSKQAGPVWSTTATTGSTARKEGSESTTTQPEAGPTRKDVTTY